MVYVRLRETEREREHDTCSDTEITLPYQN